jgi:hypothetical protein
MLKTPENQKNKAIEFITVGINPTGLCKTVKSTGLGRENYISATYEGPIYIN